jgi:hypothetical protein
VSGGQTGADRAALEWALGSGLPTGGWVPRGRLAEDGVIPERIPGLQEADSDQPAFRTRLNVRDSDATLIVSSGPLSGGSALTLRHAAKLGRPALHLRVAARGEARRAVVAFNETVLDMSSAVDALVGWLKEHRPRVLNVAGPRASKEPGIAAVVHELLERAL